MSTTEPTEPSVSRSVLLRTARILLGPLARVWYRNGRIEIGLERSGEKVVLAAGETPRGALFALDEAAKRAAALPNSSA